MTYPFPEIRIKCPLCEESNCAIYKGYYRRFVMCPEMEIASWVAIRVGLCKSTKTRFALLPDFLIPRRKISRMGHELLLEYYKRSQQNIYATLDDWLDGLDDEFFLSRSTAMNYLAVTPGVPP